MTRAEYLTGVSNGLVFALQNLILQTVRDLDTPKDSVPGLCEPAVAFENGWAVIQRAETIALAHAPEN